MAASEDAVSTETKLDTSSTVELSGRGFKDIKSPGVARAEAISAAITQFDRIFIFFGVFLIAYAYGLDGILRYTYQPYATESFASHSLLSTVNVARSVIATAIQPTAAKIADVFGRIELISFSVFFYVLGTAVEAASTNVATFAAGSVVYQIGFTMVILLVEVVIADITSTRSRLFFSYVPAFPFVINTWISGNIAQAVLGVTEWHWGIGMWCIIYPICALPLIASLWVVSRRAKKQGRLSNYHSSLEVLGMKSFSFELFWLLDVIGILLVIAFFAFILVPLTIAGGLENSWRSAHVIVPLVVGVLCIPGFVFWELRAPHPLIPFVLMKDRSVWAPIGIAIFLNFAYSMQSDYLYSVLVVAFDFSIKAATRVVSLYSFVSVIMGPLTGLVVYRVRRLKIFVVIGTILYMAAFGLLVHYRGNPTTESRAGVIGAQVLLGIAGGLFPYSTQASLQVQLKHEHLAVMTGIFLVTYNIGSALGNSISGAMWTQLLPSKLEESLAGINSTLVADAYRNPFESVVAVYPVGTLERTAVINAYQSIQRLLTIAGTCLCVPLVVFAFLLRNPQLNDEQTLAKDVEATDGGDLEMRTH